jgi:hypothetical protein
MPETSMNHVSGIGKNNPRHLIHIGQIVIVVLRTNHG